MQVVLIGDDDFPPKTLIRPILDFHSKIQRTDFVLSTETSVIMQFLADCFIYIERSPSKILIDQLQETGSPLILVADADYRSQLFIPFDNFMPTSFSAESLEVLTKNINSLASLYEMEYQRNLFPLILTDEGKEKREHLLTDGSHHNSGEAVVTDNLTDIHKEVLLRWSKGVPELEILNSLKICRRKYYGILTEIRVAYGVTTNRELLSKIK